MIGAKTQEIITAAITGRITEERILHRNPIRITKVAMRTK
jgi:hypothetical protein